MAVVVRRVVLSSAVCQSSSMPSCRSPARVEGKTASRKGRRSFPYLAVIPVNNTGHRENFLKGLELPFCRILSFWCQGRTKKAALVLTTLSILLTSLDEEEEGLCIGVSGVSA